MSRKGQKGIGKWKDGDMQAALKVYDERKALYGDKKRLINMKEIALSHNIKEQTFKDHVKNRAMGRLGGKAKPRVLNMGKFVSYVVGFQ